MFGKKVEKNFLTRLIERAKDNSVRVLLPESTDERVLKAACMAADQGLCKVVLLGKEENFGGVVPPRYLKKMGFLDPMDKKLQAGYASKLLELRAHKGMTAEEAASLIFRPTYFATLALKCGDVDGVVAGAVHETADVLRPAFQIIKTAPDVSIASSSMIMEQQNRSFGNDGVLVMGDCGVVTNPSAEQLAEIALQCSQTAKTVAGFEVPRVALLSYSTKSAGDSGDESVKKVKEAFLLVRRKDSSLIVDGELQVDSALVPEVAQNKCPYSRVKGNANVLVFPNLDSGNIGYKLAARLSGATTIGPILQGLDKPVNDVSRGATTQEILGAIAVTVLQAKNNQNKTK